MKIKYNIYNNNNKFLLLLLLYFNINNNNIYCQNNRLKKSLRSNKNKDIKSYKKSTNGHKASPIIPVNNDYNSSPLNKDVNNGNLSEMDTDVSDGEGSSTQVSDNESNSTKVSDNESSGIEVIDNKSSGIEVSESDDLSEMKMDVSDDEGKDNQLKDLDQDNEDNKNFDNTGDNNLKKEKKQLVEKRSQSKPMTILQKGLIGGVFIGIVSFIIYVYIKWNRNKKKITGKDGGKEYLNGTSKNEGGTAGTQGGGLEEEGFKNGNGRGITGKSGVLNQVKHNLTESLTENLITIQTEILESMKENDIGINKKFNVIKINTISEQNQYIIPKTTDTTNTINVIEFYSNISTDDETQQLEQNRKKIEEQIQQHNNNIIKDIIKKIFKLQSEQKEQDKIIDEFINDKFNGTYYNELDKQLFGYLMGQAQEKIDITNEANRIPLIKFYKDPNTNEDHYSCNDKEDYNCILKNSDIDIQTFKTIKEKQLSEQQQQDQDDLEKIIADLKEAKNIPITKEVLTDPESEIRKYTDKYDLLYNAFKKSNLYNTMQQDEKLTQGTYYSIPINNTTIQVYIENSDKEITFSFYEQLSNGLIIKKIFTVDKYNFENNNIYHKSFTNNDCTIYDKNINIANKQISWFGYNINESNEITQIYKNKIVLYIGTIRNDYKDIENLLKEEYKKVLDLSNKNIASYEEAIIMFKCNNEKIKKAIAEKILIDKDNEQALLSKDIFHFDQIIQKDRKTLKTFQSKDLEIINEINELFFMNDELKIFSEKVKNSIGQFVNLQTRINSLLKNIENLNKTTEKTVELEKKSTDEQQQQKKRKKNKQK